MQEYMYTISINIRDIQPLGGFLVDLNKNDMTNEKHLMTMFLCSPFMGNGIRHLFHSKLPFLILLVSFK